MLDKLIQRFETEKDKAASLAAILFAQMGLGPEWSAAASNPFDMSGTARGQADASGAVNLVVALVVGGLMAAFLLPIAIDEIANVDTSGWDGGAAALWGILPVMIVLAVFLFFVGVALQKSGRI